MLRLEPFTSDERGHLSPPQKGKRDSRPRASRGREQRDTRPRPAMNPRSPKVKYLRPMAVPPLLRTFSDDAKIRLLLAQILTVKRLQRTASSPGCSSSAKLGDLADGSSCRARTAPRYREAFVTVVQRYRLECHFRSQSCTHTRAHTHAHTHAHARTRTHTPARARTHARARTTDDERRDVRSSGVADWIAVRRGNTERTLTTEAGPSPCDPYRHALARRPPRKAPAFLFLKLQEAWAECR